MKKRGHCNFKKTLIGQTLIFISIFILLIAGSGIACSTANSQNQDTVTGKASSLTYEETVIKIIEGIEDTSAGLPSDELIATSYNANYDAKTNYRKLREAYLKIKELEPPEQHEITNKRILRSLKYAIEGMSMLIVSGKSQNKSMLTQSSLLINLNIDDVRKAKDNFQ